MFSLDAILETRKKRFPKKIESYERRLKGASVSPNAAIGRGAFSTWLTGAVHRETNR